MKKVLIAGETEKTSNYENAMRHLGVHAKTSLHVPSTCAYDGLILPGGGDIDPRLFGQLPNGTRFFDSELDRIQMEILRAFVSDRKPVPRYAPLRLRTSVSPPFSGVPSMDKISAS